MESLKQTGLKQMAQLSETRLSRIFNCASMNLTCSSPFPIILLIYYSEYETVHGTSPHALKSWCKNLTGGTHSVVVKSPHLKNLITQISPRTADERCCLKNRNGHLQSQLDLDRRFGSLKRNWWTCRVEGMPRL